LFTDDTKLYYLSKSIDDLQHVLNHEMAALWFKTNKLSSNIEKTSHILFCASNAWLVPELSFELLESTKVKRVKSYKFLAHT